MSVSKKSSPPPMIRTLKGKISPDRWSESGASNFPDGSNPWSDIYTEKTVLAIANTINLKSPEAVRELRLQLAATAEYLFSFFDFTGGPKTSAQKLKWSSNANAECQRLMAAISDSDDFLFTIALSSRDKNAVKFIPALEMRRRVQKTKEAVTALQEILQARTKISTDEDEPTSHALTLQLVADAMTEVFIHFKCADQVKRTSSAGHIDGEFPEFVRASSKPFLKAYHTKFALNPSKFENLDRQIQASVKRYRP